MSPDDHLLADPFSLPDRRFAADTLGTAVLAWAGNTAQAAIEDWVETSRWLEAPHAEVLDELVAQLLKVGTAGMFPSSIRPPATIGSTQCLSACASRMQTRAELSAGGATSCDGSPSW